MCRLQDLKALKQFLIMRHPRQLHNGTFIQQKKKMKKNPKKTFKTFRLEKTTENQELHKNQKSNRFQS